MRKMIWFGLLSLGLNFQTSLGAEALDKKSDKKVKLAECFESCVDSLIGCVVMDGVWGSLPCQTDWKSCYDACKTKKFGKKMCTPR